MAEVSGQGLFQSSIAPKGDRNVSPQDCRQRGQFQSSIAPKGDRNNALSSLLEQQEHGSNPRSPRRATATRNTGENAIWLMFQSSIAPKGDRNIAMDEDEGEDD